MICGMGELDDVLDQPYDQVFYDCRKKDTVVLVVVVVVRCGNWEETGERVVFVRSVRYDESGSKDLKTE